MQAFFRAENLLLQRITLNRRLIATLDAIYSYVRDSVSLIAIGLASMDKREAPCPTKT
jgi:hypothetical protein